MENANKIRNRIIEEYRKAFTTGTKQAWDNYHKFLNKLAEEVDADSTMALEDWAFNTVNEVK